MHRAWIPALTSNFSIRYPDEQFPAGEDDSSQLPAVRSNLFAHSPITVQMKKKNEQEDQ